VKPIESDWTFTSSTTRLVQCLTRLDLYQLYHQIGSVSDSKTLAIQRLEVGLEVQSDIVDAVALEWQKDTCWSW
jgi:hypothetical protein